MSTRKKDMIRFIRLFVIVFSIVMDIAVWALYFNRANASDSTLLILIGVASIIAGLAIILIEPIELNFTKYLESFVYVGSFIIFFFFAAVVFNFVFPLPILYFAFPTAIIIVTSIFDYSDFGYTSRSLIVLFLIIARISIAIFLIGAYNMIFIH